MNYSAYPICKQSQNDACHQYFLNFIFPISSSKSIAQLLHYCQNNHQLTTTTSFCVQLLKYFVQRFVCPLSSNYCRRFYLGFQLDDNYSFSRLCWSLRRLCSRGLTFLFWTCPGRWRWGCVAWWLWQNPYICRLCHPLQVQRWLYVTLSRTVLWNLLYLSPLDLRYWMMKSPLALFELP